MVSESTRHSKRRSLTGGASRLAVAALVLASLGTAGSSSAAEDSTYPGLPAFTAGGGWVGPRATGLNEVARAKQWVRTPPLIIAAFNRVSVNREDNSCGRLFPFRSTEDYHATAFLRSSKAAPDPYGHIGPFKVRTVAFGAIPVEATVAIRQPRDAEDLPVGLEIKQKLNYYCAAAIPYPNIPVPGQGTDNTRVDPASVRGQVDVVVTSLKVDGTELGLKAACRTEAPGELDLSSPVWFSMNPENLIPGVSPAGGNLMTTPYFSMANGGLLTGTIDVPAFAGCTTSSGEDVSRLLTATVSGPGNPVTMRSEGLRGTTCMDPDISTEPGDLCGPLPDLDFP